MPIGKKKTGKKKSDGVYNKPEGLKDDFGKRKMPKPPAKKKPHSKAGY